MPRHEVQRHASYVQVLPHTHTIQQHVSRLLFVFGLVFLLASCITICRCLTFIANIEVATLLATISKLIILYWCISNLFVSSSSLVSGCVHLFVCAIHKWEIQHTIPLLHQFSQFITSHPNKTTYPKERGVWMHVSYILVPERVWSWSYWYDNMKVDQPDIRGWVVSVLILLTNTGGQYFRSRKSLVTDPRSMDQVP